MALRLVGPATSLLETLLFTDISATRGVSSTHAQMSSSHTVTNTESDHGESGDDGSSLSAAFSPTLFSGGGATRADPPFVRLLPIADGCHVVDARELLLYCAVRDLAVLAHDEGEWRMPRVHQRKSRWTPLGAQGGSAGIGRNSSNFLNLKAH